MTEMNGAASAKGVVAAAPSFHAAEDSAVEEAAAAPPVTRLSNIGFGRLCADAAISASVASCR